MTLDVLSNIKGAKPSKDINDLFETMKSAVEGVDNKMPFLKEEDAVLLDDLRPDEVIQSSEIEKEIIRGNFPSESKGYLVVAKVIED